MTVAYEELRRTMSFTPEGATAERVLKIAGSDLETLIDELFDCTFVANAGFVTKKRAVHPQFSWMYADGVDATPSAPENPPAAGSTYAYLDVTVKYRGDAMGGSDWPLNDPTPPSGTYLTHDIEFGMEMMTLPTGAWKWKGGGVWTSDLNPAILVPTTTHRLKWSRVTDPPWDFIRECQGCVHYGKWADADGLIHDDLFMGAAAETLLFCGCNASRTYDAQGNQFWTLEMVFKERAVKYTVNGETETAGWLELYHSGKSPPWDYPQNVATGEYMYATRNFNSLFNLK